MTDHWTESTCGYRAGRPTNTGLRIGDTVTLCTAQYVWTIGRLDPGEAMLMPARGDKWRDRLFVHPAHLDLTTAIPQPALFDLEEAGA